MSETEKQKDPAPSRLTRKISRFVGRIQRSFSRFLLWLSSLLREPQSRKAALARFLRGAGTIVSNMSPARFTCLMMAIAAIVISIIFFVIPPNSAAKDYISRPIAIWFSEMGDYSDPNYLPKDTDEATKMINWSLDVFEVKACEPSESDPSSNEIVVNAIVGCYRARGLSNMKELRIRVAGLEGDELLETYETLSALPADQIVRRIRERIFETYPPRGSIYKLQREEDVPPEQRESQKREVFVDIGRLAGVREGDMFDVLPSDKTKFFRNITRLTIMESNPMRSMALVSWDEKIEEGYCVKWVKGGW